MKSYNQILSNEDLIRILQDGTGKGETRIYTYLKEVFHTVMVYQLIKPGRDLPGPGIQRMIAEEAFQKAFMALLKNVREGSFEARAKERKTAGCTGYFFAILWNTYQHELKRKCNRNFYSFDELVHARPVEMSPDLPAYNLEDGIIIMLQTAVRLLQEKCRKYMQWQYIEQKETKEIISLVTDAAPGTVIKDLSICRGKLEEKMKELYNIDF